MPLDLNELEDLEPAAAAGLRGKIDEDELLEMCADAAYSTKEVKEHFGTAHGTANSALTKLFRAKVLGRVKGKTGPGYYYSSWDNFPASFQKEFEKQIKEIEEAEAEREAAKKEAEE